MYVYLVPGLAKSVPELPQEVLKSIRRVATWTPEGQHGVARATPGLKQRCGSKRRGPGHEKVVVLESKMVQNQ